jgi:hypothetical protein
MCESSRGDDHDVIGCLQADMHTVIWSGGFIPSLYQSFHSAYGMADPIFNNK